MDNQKKGFDGNKIYSSTVALLKFKSGTLHGFLLLEFYFMAVILLSNTSFKDVDVDVLISSTMQPSEVPERIKNVLRAALQNFDDRKMFYSEKKRRAG